MRCFCLDEITCACWNGYEMEIFGFDLCLFKFSWNLSEIHFEIFIVVLRESCVVPNFMYVNLMYVCWICVKVCSCLAEFLFEFFLFGMVWFSMYEWYVDEYHIFLVELMLDLCGLMLFFSFCKMIILVMTWSIMMNTWWW